MEVRAGVGAGIEAALARKEQLIKRRSAERCAEGRTNPEGRINRPVQTDFISRILVTRFFVLGIARRGRKREILDKAHFAQKRRFQFTEDFIDLFIPNRRTGRRIAIDVARLSIEPRLVINGVGTELETNRRRQRTGRQLEEVASQAAAHEMRRKLRRSILLSIDVIALRVGQLAVHQEALVKHRQGNAAGGPSGCVGADIAARAVRNDVQSIGYAVGQQTVA
ncbi:hypothetical protein D3C72_553920 [compost metagenome]